MDSHRDDSDSPWEDKHWQLLQVAMDQLTDSWRHGSPPLAEFVPVNPADPHYWEMVQRMIDVDQELCKKYQVSKDPDAYLSEFPQLQNKPDLWRRIKERIVKGNEDGMDPPPLRILCPHCRNKIRIIHDQLCTGIDCPACGSAFDPDDGGALIGKDGFVRKVAHFELREQLGMGAFGSVWKAFDPQLRKLVAIKVPRKGQLGPVDAERFVDEARLAAQLRHPNIVAVHAVGQDGSQHYIVSDYVEGGDLTQWRMDREMAHEEIALLCAIIADALHHAHEHKIVHCDVKPHNILMDADGEPYLTDFGLARCGQDPREITITASGLIFGSPAYMSPEQAQGKRVDRRTDVYSLGVVLFELLTRELPFSGNIPQLLRRIAEDDPPRARSLDRRIPRALDTICATCLEKAPEQRYQSAKELAQDLRRFVSGDPISRPWDWGRRAWK